MTISRLRTALRRALIIGAAAGISATAGQLNAQSDVVFMTADIDPGGDSQLVRFDSGSESYTTDTGGSDLFLGVTVLNGEVLVADYGSEEIQRFDPDGTYLGPFASSILAIFLESDSNQNVYTTPWTLGPLLGANYATRFDSTGAVTRVFSHPSINAYSGIDADADGNVYVAGASAPPTNLSRLYKFAPDGTFLNSIPLTASADDVSIDEVNKRLFMAHESGAPGIEIYDIAGAVPVLAGSIATPVTADIVGIHHAAESGNILATDFGIGSGDARGLEYSPIGILLAEYRPTNAGVALDITTFSTIPEPGSMIVALLAVCGLGLKRSARRR